MRLWMLGVSHRHAGAALRERVALQGDALAPALAALGSFASERIILSTCTRTEIYVILHADTAADGSLTSTHGHGDSLLRDWLCATAGLPQGALDAASEVREGRDVVRHLLRVASGLDSAVLGEPQVLAQTTTALNAARAAQAAGPVLSRLFQEAIRTGKQVRSHTGVARNRLSTAHAGLDLAERALGGSGALRGRRVAVLGAGEIAGIAARVLRNRGAETVIINRSAERAERLATDVAARATTLDALPHELASADLLVAAIQAPAPLITPDLLADRAQPLVIVDLSLPRAVDPAVDLQPDVRRFDVDDLESAAADLRDAYAHDLAAAGGIIDAATERCWCWLQERPAAPAIDALRRHAANARDTQLARILPRLGHLNERDREQVMALANGIVNAMLHDPAVQLRAAARDGNLDSARNTLEALFGNPTAQDPDDDDDGFAADEFAAAEVDSGSDADEAAQPEPQANDAPQPRHSVTATDQDTAVMAPAPVLPPAVVRQAAAAPRSTLLAAVAPFSLDIGMGMGSHHQPAVSGDR